MNLREKVDEDHCMSNYGLESDEIDFVERNYEVIRGYADDYKGIISFITSNSLSFSINSE